MSSKKIVKRHKKFIANFDFGNRNVDVFERHNEHDMDCVINALEYLEKIDTRCSKYMRILFKNKPIEGIYIQNFFEIEMPNHKWVITEYPNFKSFVNKLKLDLNIRKACICLFETPIMKSGNRDGHVALIARDINGKLVLIDGQKDDLIDLSIDTVVEKYFKKYDIYSTLDIIR